MPPIRFRSRPPTFTGISLAGISLVIITLLGGGCSSEAPIVTYEIPTTMPAALATEDTRMLAAIIPQESQAWFFKVMGRQSAVDSVNEEFRRFVENVEFEDGVPVLDNLPEGWRRGGERAMRFASIDVNTPTQQLDVSISQLARMDDWEKLVAMNINRWRGQVGLKNSDEKWAGATVLETQVKIDDAPAVWLDLTGRPDESAAPMGGMIGEAGPMGGTGPMGEAGPMSEMMASASSASSAAGSDDPHAGLPREARQAIASGELKAPGKAKDETPKLKFDRPEDWRDGRMSMMRLAAFNVGPEDQTAEVTVITAGGDLRGNVARWMGQIRQSAVPEEEVDAALENAEKLQVDGRDAQRFLLLPEQTKQTDKASGQTAIDATIVPMQEGFSMFIKMTGPVEIVQAQREQMRTFLESLRL